MFFFVFSGNYLFITQKMWCMIFEADGDLHVKKQSQILFFVSFAPQQQAIWKQRL